MAATMAVARRRRRRRRRSGGGHGEPAVIAGHTSQLGTWSWRRWRGGIGGGRGGGGGGRRRWRWLQTKKGRTDGCVAAPIYMMICNATT